MSQFKTTLQQVVNELDAEIARLSSARQTLSGVLAETTNGVAATAATTKRDNTVRPKAPRLDVRSSKPRKPATPTALNLDRPTTMGGAVKLVIRSLNGQDFTFGQLREIMERDYADLLEKSPTGLKGNISYWASHGKLSKTGEGADAVYRVQEKEWFEPAA